MTWKILIDLIKRAIRGSNPSITSIWDEEVREYAMQTLNNLLGLSYFQEVLPSGDTTPDGCVLAVYTDIEVEKYQGKSRAKLPAYPVRLPRNMGVFLIAPNDDEEAQFIPIPAGQSGMIKKMGMMSNLFGMIGYEVKNGYAVFTKELNIPTVQMHLVVVDFNHYKETDLLPIPSNLYKKVIDETAKMYIQHIMPDKIVDSNSEPTNFSK